MSEFLSNRDNYRSTTQEHSKSYPERYRKSTEMLWVLYKKQQNAHWAVEEIDFSADMHDFKNLDIHTQQVIKKILAFFANSDSLINLGIGEILNGTVQIREALCGYGCQQNMENIHGECYSLMINNLISSPQERERLFDSVFNDETIRKITLWGAKWINGDTELFGLDSKGNGVVNDLDKTLIAMACLEGIVFSGAFAVIYWIRDTLCRDKMILKGLMQSNDLIARDEAMHTHFGCVMHNLVDNKTSQKEAHNMIKEIVEITKEFNISAIRSELTGLNADNMNCYTEYVADILSRMLGYDYIYNVSNPFSFMENIQLTSKDNFFDGKNASYQKCNIGPYLPKMYDAEFNNLLKDTFRQNLPCPVTFWMSKDELEIC